MDISAALASSLDRMPHFPETFHRLAAIPRHGATESKDMVAVLSKDPVVTFRILRVVNSAYFGMAREIGSLDHAMLVLGPNSIRNMVLTFAAVGALPPKLADSFDVDRFLLHSLTTAAVAEELAKHFNDTGTPEAYTAGLLHDFGKVLLAWTFPKEFAEATAHALQAQTPLLEAEKRLFGTDHAALGASLARMWNFPTPLAESIAAHHEAPPAEGLGRCLFLANQLPKLFDMDTGADELPDPLPQQLAPSLGDTYEEILAAMPMLNRSASRAASMLAAIRH